MVRTIPVLKPEQLVLLNWTSPKILETFESYATGSCAERPPVAASGCSFSLALFQDVRLHNQVFSETFAFARLGRRSINISGQAGWAQGELISGDYFGGLGVQPVLGRAISEADNKIGAPPVADVSYGFWKWRFGGDPAAIGRRVIISNVPFTIVGVMPKEFFGVERGFPRDFWAPIAMQPRLETGDLGTAKLVHANYWWLAIMGRLKPGISSAAARANLDSIFLQSLSAGQARPLKSVDTPRIYLASASRGIETLRDLYSKPLWILSGVALLVLLAACANVANLLLSRALARHREMAVRRALGASRIRLVRQLLTESLLLALIAGLVGLTLAYIGSRLLITMTSTWGEPITLTVGPTPSVVGFITVVALLTGLLFGLAPAWRVSHGEFATALRSADERQSRKNGQIRLGLGEGLVALQVALTLLLIFGAGLFTRTLANLKTEDLGFSRKGVLLFSVNPGETYKGERLADYYRRVFARLDRLPGVISTTTSSMALAGTDYSMSPVFISDYTPRSNRDTMVYKLSVGAKFFETVGIPLLLGRGITYRDIESSNPVAVVNEAFVHRYLPNEHPIGRYFRWDKKGKDVEIIGIARNIRNVDVRTPPGPMVYSALSLFGDDGASEVLFSVRSAGDASALIPEVRSAVAELDGSVPISQIRTQNEVIEESFWDVRLIAVLSGTFGILALVLAASGLYGVMSYAVSRRTREIGVRMALGAEPRRILTMILVHALTTVLIGIGVGLGVALASVRLVRNELFEVGPFDPTAVVASILLIVVVAGFSAYRPASRACRLEPMTSLRQE
jgi:predicted permease